MLLCVLLAAPGPILAGAGAPMAANSLPVSMHTACIGRHLIDVPATFALMAGVTSLFTPQGLNEQGGPIQFSLHALEIGRAQFQAAVAKRHAELLAAQRANRRLLKQVMPVSDDATLFRVLEVGRSYRSELHLWRGNAYAIATTASYEDSFLEAEARLLAFAGNIASVGGGKPGGFCLGPLRVHGSYAGEYASLGFRDPDAPGVILSLELDTFGPDESVPLLKRAGGVGTHVVRKGERSVAGMRAQEWLGWTTIGGSKQVGFALETMRPVPHLYEPRLHVALDSGQAGPGGEREEPALDTGAMVVLWDAILGTLRRQDGGD